jgi:hypothetical protein
MAGGRLLLLLVGLVALLTGCAPPLSQREARATAEAGGCWPLGVDQPITPLPASAVPTVVAYVACTPLPGTPTATVRPTLTPTAVPPPTPPPAFAKGGLATLGQAPGTATLRSRAVHTPALALHPRDGRAVVAWLSWGAGLDAYAGDVWVRVQGKNGDWTVAQTANTSPVKSSLGGLGITWTISDELIVAYGDGGWEGSAALWTATSRDGGETWGASERLGQGQIDDLASDAAGQLHAVVLEGAEVVSGRLRYGVRAAGGGTWRWSSVGPGAAYNARLALLPLPGGGLRRFILAADATDSTRLTLWSSDDGERWSGRAMPLGRYLAQEHPTATDLLAVPRPGSEGLVAVAWSQPNGPGDVAGGVFATLSLDGGVTWGAEERIAQHRSDGSFGDGNGGQIGGFEPSLGYDAGTDRLAVSWVEDDLNRAEGRAASSTDRVVRTLLAARELTMEATTWRFAVTPEGDGDAPPQLTPWGVRGWLAAGGRWLVAVDERNRVAQVQASPLQLAALLAQGGP